MNLPTEATDSAVNQDISGTVGHSSNQKRPRDYGEELKGLPTSDDEGDKNASFPAQKKQKTDGVDADDSGLDDGEIVESSPVPYRGPERSNEEVVRDAVMHEFSEDGEVGSSAADPADSQTSTEPFFVDKNGSKSIPRSSWNEGVSLGTRVSFGNATTPLFPEPSRRDREDSSESEGGDDDAEEDEEESKPDTWPQRQPKTMKTRTFTAGNDPTEWKYPAPRKVSIKPDQDPLNPDFWVQKLRDWTVALLHANEPSIAGSLSPEVIRTGFIEQLRGKPNPFLGRKKSKTKKAFIGVARTVIIETDLQALISDVRGDGLKDANPAKEVIVISNDDDDDDESMGQESAEEAVTFPMSNGEDNDELEQQRKYFPGVQDPSRYCLSCSGIGHKSNQCPQLRCKFCESKSHSSFGCPTKQRCPKCRQLGHTVGVCQEKLALTVWEQGACTFCGAEHAEAECTEIWRSFVLSAETLKKVKDIPAFCYTCGAQGHYGPECGLPDRGGNLKGRTTWSQVNRLLYIDDASSDVAIGWANVNLPSPPHGEFHIRGNAKRPTHTHFVSSDESDGDDLVHAPIQRAGPRSEIRISSNISSAPVGQNPARGGSKKNKNRIPKGDRDYVPPPSPPPPPPPQPRRGRSNRGSSRQPPLPPGPPPSTMPSYNFRGSLPSAALSSLPPRPQTFDHGGPSTYGSNHQSRGNRGAYRGPNRGNRGGRGGGRGNGRGNGRGGRGRGRGD